MARIFSIEFTYKDTVHHGMITVRDTPFHKEYKISLQEEILHDLLPSDKIISPEPDKFIFANTSPQTYSDLMKQILAAVAEHVHLLQY
jgi:hypothetical protein